MLEDVRQPQIIDVSRLWFDVKKDAKSGDNKCLFMVSVPTCHFLCSLIVFKVKRLIILYNNLDMLVWIGDGGNAIIGSLK